MVSASTNSGHENHAPNGNPVKVMRDENAAQDAADNARRTVRREIREKADRTDKFLLAAMVLFVGLPAFALAGWLVWDASDARPWLMSFGTVLVVMFLVNWPLAFWLKRQAWFNRMAGDGWYREVILKFLTLYLPMLVIVGVNDLDHSRSMAENLREYLVTIAGFLVLLVAAETALTLLSRWWNARRGKRGARR